MTIRRLAIGISLALLVAAPFSAAASAGQAPVKPKQALNIQFRPFPDLKTCLNCAKLDVRIFSLPGDGCLHCDDLATYLGTYAFIDPDLYIKNLGNLPSNPGTVTLQWYDLVNKGPANVTLSIPAVPVGEWTAVSIPNTHIIFKKEEGVRMTIDYSDTNGARHKVRTVTKCPDN